MPSRPVAYGRNVNFSVVAGKSELDSSTWKIALKSAPGRDLIWTLDSTDSDANRMRNLNTTSLYEEYSSAPMSWTEPTTEQNYGGSGLTYVVTSQTFNQSYRVETSLDGGAITYLYTPKAQSDPNAPPEFEWSLLSQEGVLREKTRASYSASSAGTYGKGDM